MADNPEYTAEPTLFCKIFPEILGESRGLLLFVVTDADIVAGMSLTRFLLRAKNFFAPF